MLDKEDPYLAFDVPGQGQPYFDDVSGGMMYWTNISAEDVADIRSNGMVDVNRFTGERTACLAIQEFGRRDGNPGTKIFAKWRARLFDGMLVGSELEAAGGVLDRLDYNRLVWSTRVREILRQLFVYVKQYPYKIYRSAAAVGARSARS